MLSWSALPLKRVSAPRRSATDERHHHLAASYTGHDQLRELIGADADHERRVAIVSGRQGIAAAAATDELVEITVTRRAANHRYRFRPRAWRLRPSTGEYRCFHFPPLTRTLHHRSATCRVAAAKRACRGGRGTRPKWCRCCHRRFQPHAVARDMTLVWRPDDKLLTRGGLNRKSACRCNVSAHPLS